MEHFITEIKINELRYLSNIVISLNPEKRQYLLLTGKNGSGTTSLLLALQEYLKAINSGVLADLFDSSWMDQYRDREQGDHILSDRTFKSIS